MSHEAPSFPLPESVLAAFPPDRIALFDWLRARVTDDMLHVVSFWDFGKDATEHFRALQAIRDTGSVAALDGMIPYKVLSLLSYSEFKEVGRKSFWKRWALQRTRPVFQDIESFHLARAFCSIAILISLMEDADDGRRDHTRFSPDSLLQCTLSCLEISPDALKLLGQLVTYGIERMPSWDQALLYYGCILTVIFQRTDMPDAEMRQWFADAAEVSLRWHTSPSQDYRMAKSFIEIEYDYDMSYQEKWTRLARETGLVD